MTMSVVRLEMLFKDGITAGVNAAGAALEKTTQAMERLGAASEKEEVVTRRTGISHESLTIKLDGEATARAKTEAAIRRHEAALASIDKALQKEKITAEEAAKQRERLSIIRERDIAKAVEDGRRIEAGFGVVEKATTNLTKSTGAQAMALRNLGIQSIDVFQQLASGAPIMMTLVQQGGQVAQMAAVTGTSLGTLAKSALGVVAGFAPWIAVAAAVGGVGLALYTVGQRANELESQQRTLSVAIRGVGRDAELSTGQLQSYVTALKQQGVAAADAIKSVSELTRNAGLSAGAIGRIIGVAPDAAAAIGQGVPETMRMLADAAAGTIGSVKKLDDAFNLLNASEAAQVRTMIEHGNKAAALDLVFGKLDARVQGLARDAMSPLEQSLRDLGNAWDGFITKVANSAPVMAAINALGWTLRGLSSVIGSAGGPETLDTLDAKIAAASQPIQGVNATAARMRRDQAEALARLTQQRNVAAQAVADAAEAGFGIPPPVQSSSPFQTPGQARAKEVYDRAAARVAGSDAGRSLALNRELGEYETTLAGLSRGSEEYTDQSGKLIAAIAATKKEIAELVKKGEEHRSGLEKAIDAYAVQTRAADELAYAYGQGRAEIQRVIATREAEQKAISEGLTPKMAKYKAVVAALTDDILKLREAEGRAKVAELTRDANEMAESQRRVMEAYDGTEASIRRVRHEEQARAAVEKTGLLPGMRDYASAVERLAAAYDESADLARDFQHEQNSVKSVFDIFGTTMDRIGQGLVSIFLEGGRAAVSFGSLARATFASVAAEIVRLGAVNPIVNWLSASDPRPTLYAAAGALARGSAGGGGASGGGGSILGSVGNAFSLGRISDALGLTNFGSQLSSAGEWLGLTGQGGLFTGIGNGISSFLGMGVNGVSQAAATNAAIAGILPPPGFSGVMYGPATPSSVLAQQGGATFGGLLGGFGLGFGAGSLGGGLLQSALGRTGPAPTIGAGLGAGAGAIIGTLTGMGPLLGGLLGGLFGGGGGAFIGPGKKNLFSATGLTLDDNGMLGVGQTFAQLADTSQEVAALQQEVATVNAILAAMGARVTNTTSYDEYGQRRINDANTNTWINVGQGDGRSQSLAFNALRFGSSDPMVNTALTGRSFENAEALANELAAFSTFLQQTAPALKQIASGDPSYGVGSLAESIKTLGDQFNAAKEVADRLGWAEYDLIDARERAIAAANDNVSQLVLEMDRSLLSRKAMAEGIASGDIRKQLDATLWDFDAQTKVQRDAMKASLLTIFGDAFEATSTFAAQMQLLEETRGAERLATAKSYLDALNAAQAQQAQQMQQSAGVAAGIIGGITNYVRGISLGGESPLTQQQQYFSASTAFNQAVSSARGGDGKALANLTGAAEAFRAQSRAMFGSGANFVTDFNNIVSSLQSIADMPADTLTSAVFSVGIQTQTQTLVSALSELKAELVAIKSTLRQSSNGPPAAQAA